MLMFNNELSRKKWADEVENLGRRKDFVVFTISMFYIYFYQPIASYQHDINGFAEQVALVSQCELNIHQVIPSINEFGQHSKCYKENC